ncbi:MAG: ATP synthase F1 subunit epsilon [Bdellovibrionota bacterium]
MFKLTIVTPEKKLVVDQEILEVTVPAFVGTLNILPGHAMLITALETGILRWKFKGQDKMFKAVVSWGYCEVHPQGVNILANIVDMPEEIKVEERKQWIIEAEKKLASVSLDDANFEIQRREIARARAGIDLLDEKY